MKKRNVFLMLVVFVLGMFAVCFSAGGIDWSLIQNPHGNGATVAGCMSSERGWIWIPV